MKHWRVPRPLESSLQSLPKLRLGLRFTAKLGIRLWNASCSDSGLCSWHTASPVRRAFLPTAQPAGRGPSFRSSLRRKKKRLLFAGSFVLVLHSKLRSCCNKQLCGRDAFVRSAFLSAIVAMVFAGLVAGSGATNSTNGTIPCAPATIQACITAFTNKVSANTNYAADAAQKKEICDAMTTYVTCLTDGVAGCAESMKTQFTTQLQTAQDTWKPHCEGGSSVSSGVASLGMHQLIPFMLLVLACFSNTNTMGQEAKQL